MDYELFFLKRSKPARFDVLQNFAVAVAAVFVEPAHHFRHIETAFHQKLHREPQIVNARFFLEMHVEKIE